MATASSNDLSTFVRYLTDQLESGRTDLSPEQALDAWRKENPLDEDFTESVAAIRAALDDMDAGDHGVPLEEFDRELRVRHHLPPAS